ncbi:MAG TPA: alpha/beta fold hydrolase, partial [Acidimicrobiales bacterium]|nr:alpha/beta fold hydrolase [Acidimicrobiales bacterium]
DQVGCGRSDRPTDPGLWRIESFVEELAAVRQQLGLDQVHLLGQSWGGMLALEYLLTKPEGVVSLTLSNSLASAPLWGEEARRLRADLPAGIQKAMRRFEENLEAKPVRPKPGAKVKKGITEKQIDRMAKVMRPIATLMTKPAVQALAVRASAVPFLRKAAYEVVGMEFNVRHACRIKPFPMPALRSFAAMNRKVYETMWGPSEFFATGNLKDWDVTSRLGEIDVPTLLISGRYDEATPKHQEIMRDAIAGSEWVLLEESSHSTHLEDPERYRQALTDFLAKAEAATHSRDGL